MSWWQWILIWLSGGTIMWGYLVGVTECNTSEQIGGAFVVSFGLWPLVTIALFVLEPLFNAGKWFGKRCLAKVKKRLHERKIALLEQKMVEREVEQLEKELNL